MKLELEKLNTQAQEATNRHIVCWGQRMKEEKSPWEVKALGMGQKHVSMYTTCVAQDPQGKRMKWV